MMRRLSLYLVGLLSLFACDSTTEASSQDAPAEAAGGVYLGASTLTSPPGSRLVVAVELTPDQHISLASGELHYDPSRLEFTGQAESSEGAVILVAGPAVAGTIRFAGIRLGGLRSVSPRLVFRVLEADYTRYLNFTMEDVAEGTSSQTAPLPPARPALRLETTLDDQVTLALPHSPSPPRRPLVGSIPPGTRYGDSNLDGRVDILDAFAIANWSVGNGVAPLPGALAELVANVVPSNIPGVGGSGDSNPPGWEPNCTRRTDLFDALDIASAAVGQTSPIAGSVVPLDAFDSTGFPRAGSGCAASLSLAFSTYLGGSQQDQVRDIATDAQGNIYVAGGTSSPDFRATVGDVTFNGTYDAFVAKLSPTGTLLWSRFLGGPNYDRAYAVEVDAAGFIYLAGRAGAGFPVTAGAFQTIFRGSPDDPPYGPQDGFVCKISPDGISVVFCSYFGTDDPQIVRDLAIDGQGAMYLGSSSLYGAFPQSWFAQGAQPFPMGGLDGVVAKISPDGSQVEWATYIGGSQDEAGEASIRVNPQGEAFALYSSASPDAPTPNGFDHSLGGPRDVYLVKISATGRKLLFGTFIGGSGGESVETHELALDPQGNPVVATGTSSQDFPTTPGAFQMSYGGSGGPATGAGSNYGGDVFVARVSADGSHLLTATYLGGSEGDGAEGVGVDAMGDVFVSGSTYSSDLSFLSRGIQPRLSGDADFFAIRLSADFSRVLAGTYLGGTLQDFARSSTVSPSGEFIIGGNIQSTDWPVLTPVQAAAGGGLDGGVAKLR
ncbi:MAG: SBBP repeat-containing protein [Gemmatimonadota bacterium]